MFASFTFRDRIFLIGLVLSIATNVYQIYLKIRTTVKQTDAERIKRLLKQSSRYAVAADQDENKAVAVLHGNYAAGYLYALLDIYSEEDILQATSINLREFKTEVQNAQAKSTSGIYEACPNVIPEKSAKILLDASQDIL